MLSKLCVLSFVSIKISPSFQFIFILFQSVMVRMESRSSSSFSSFRAYSRALSDTPRRLAWRACSVSTSFEETSQARARSGTDLKRTLRWYDLVGFGLGGMVGAGVFVTTGTASRMYAGPSVVLSYAIAGLCALLSAFCYTEFAVDMPVAGGAFSYIRVTFGKVHLKGLLFLTFKNDP